MKGANQTATWVGELPRRRKAIESVPLASSTREHRQLVEQAYRAYGHSVLRRARQMLGDEQEARDVMQEVFVALLDRPLTFEGRSALGTYLYSATTHRCFNRL